MNYLDQNIFVLYPIRNWARSQQVPIYIHLQWCYVIQTAAVGGGTIYFLLVILRKLQCKIFYLFFLID